MISKHFGKNALLEITDLFVWIIILASVARFAWDLNLIHTLATKL